MNLQCVYCRQQIKERQSFAQMYGGGLIHEFCFLSAGTNIPTPHHIAREVNMQPVGEPLTADDVLDIYNELQTQQTKR